MNAPGLRRLGTIASILFLAAVAGALWYVVPAGAGVGSVAAFAVAAIFGELLVIETPRGRPLPTSLAVMAAFALLGNPPWQLALVALAGWCGGAVIRLAAEQRPRLHDAIGRVATGWALGGLAAVGTAALDLQLWSTTAAAQIDVIAVLLVFACLVVAPPLMATAEAAWETGVPLRPVFIGQLIRTAGISSALASSAVLAALAHGHVQNGEYQLLGPWALALMALPILAVRGGMKRLADVRRGYDQTVVAMSRVAELTGHMEEGHGVRVGALAVDVARELGLPAFEVEVVERAAYLHELGRLSTDDALTAADDNLMAMAGAAIVREAGGMDRVARAIERHRDPYRRQGQSDDPDVPMAARIVRTVCEFDRAVHAGPRTRRTWDAIDRLSLGMAYEHDPIVIQALTRTLERRGEV